MIFSILFLTSRFAYSFDYFFQGTDWPDLCNQGTKQTPIDIEADLTVKILSNEPEYSWIEFHMQELGLQANTDGGGYKFLGDFGSMTMYQGNLAIMSTKLVNFHFHSPSENYLNGSQFDLEMHVVMEDEAKIYSHAVFGVLFKVEEGAFNTFIDKVAKAYYGNMIITLAEAFTSLQVKNYLQFSGSLTTPPCTENVFWIIDTNVRKISPEQFNFFNRMWAGNEKFAGGNGNNRMIQPINDRTVTHFIGFANHFGYIGILLGFYLL
ncbi:hypothetical protein SteCoe_25004 [Stentor coeruleus]|uniref:Carbonic anhydrase n=1 Tax=Stentor coeruleus TaxID=5963 RepID=A0A1R2BGB3_9CILI|nr:hypothetical protein SteCoe_25004 [Stentor coeruleus]